MLLRQLKSELGYKSIKSMARGVGISERTLESVVVKSEEIQDKKCTELIMKHKEINNKELLEMIEFFRLSSRTRQIRDSL